MTTLNSQHNQFTSPASNSGFNFGDFKSLKDFRKSKEIPKFKFTSDKVKEILNPKSLIYSEPNIPQEMDKHQFTWKHKMAEMNVPDKVLFIKNGLESAKSQSYNILQTAKRKLEKQERKRVFGAEGSETMTKGSFASTVKSDNINKQVSKGVNNGDTYDVTDAKLERYRNIQKDYLEFLRKMKLPIPKDKEELYRILVLKDYYSSDLME